MAGSNPTSVRLLARQATASLLTPNETAPATGTGDFLSLPQQGKVQAMYVWIGGSNEDLRGKTKTLNFVPKSPDELPEWNFDGSSTGQAPGNDSEVILKPVAIFRDPFRRGENILVMCETYQPDGTPLPTNYRAPFVKTMEQAAAQKPWFGIEQEFTLFSREKWPLGWPDGGYPGPQGPYYCSVGADVSFGRGILEHVYRACLYAGVKIAGSNAEVMPGQWEIQVGPCEGVSIGDHLWMARYILHRVGELNGVVVSFDPKPIPGDWNGAGCHTNFSTLAMREDGGLKVIEAAMPLLEKRHMQHIQVYGTGNERRLTGRHETAKLSEFSWGFANRGASIRVGRESQKAGKGYLEDRRPASNIDPYIVANRLVKTVCLDQD